MPSRRIAFLVLAAVAASLPLATRMAATAGRYLRVGVKLVPTCAGALWGFYRAHNSLPEDTYMEGRVGRKFDILKRYH